MAKVRTVPFATHPCACVKRHVPAVDRTHIHHIHPKAWGGSDDQLNLVPLCPTGHDEVHLILQAFVRFGGRMPRKRSWNRYLYRIAVAGWESLD